MNDYASTISLEVSNPGDKKGYRLVNFTGDLDKAGLEQVQSQLEEIEQGLTDDELYMVYNFAKLNFINSESIGFLLKIHSRMVKRNKKLVIVGAADHVKDVLNVIGLIRIIDYYQSMAEFEKTL